MVGLLNEPVGKVAIVFGSARNIGRVTTLTLAHTGTTQRLQISRKQSLWCPTTLRLMRNLIRF